MTKYDNRGHVKLWRTTSKNPKAPSFQGRLIAHRDIKEGEPIDIALWENTYQGNNTPALRGKIKDWPSRGAK